MRLTTEQRICALERDNVVLGEKIKLLHKLLKEQHELINEYITHQITSSKEKDGKIGIVCAAEAQYTFKCRRRFKMIEKHIEKMNKLIEKPKHGLKAS
jgi:hypothetical protein